MADPVLRARRTTSGTRSWFAITAVTVVLLVAACGSESGAPPTTTTTTTAAATPTEAAVPSSEVAGLTPDDVAYVAAFRSLLPELAPDIWPSWGEVAPPLLQRGEQLEYLVGHPDPPAPFEPTGASVGGAEIHTAPAGTETPAAVASTWEVDGVWVAMIPLRPVFEDAVADVLGPGVVKWDDGTYLRAMFSEAFHAHQFSTMSGELPSFGEGDVGDPAAMEELSAVSDLEAAYAEEARHLHAAITAPSLSETRQHAVAFLQERETRRRKLGDEVAGYEVLVEWAEGTARYADHHLLVAAAGSDVAPGDLQLGDATAIRRQYLDDLVTSTSRADGVRGWWQALGSAQGMLLDRIWVGWHTEVLPGGESLEGLVEQALAVPEPLDNVRVGKIRLGPEEQIVAMATTPQEWTDGLSGVESLGGLAGMLFDFGEPIDGVSFDMNGALMPLDLAVFDPDGALLDVITMPLCDATPCPTFRPDEAFRYALETPADALDDVPAGATLIVPGQERR